MKRVALVLLATVAFAACQEVTQPDEADRLGEPRHLHAATLAPTLVYSNDFQTTAGAEWSSIIFSTTPSGRRFLGRFGTGASLTLGTGSPVLPGGLPAHNSVTVTFELFIIGTWDGHTDDPRFGPDVWNLSVSGGPTLLNTTFDNHVGFSAHVQAFPGTYPGANNLPKAGAAEKNTLGYGGQGDAVYSLSFTFPHSGSSLGLNFSGVRLQSVGDESWGVDNVVVAVALQIEIDIKPGSDPNSISCNNENETVTVAILTTDDFDATTVDHTTVTFEGASETHVNKKTSMARRHEEDVDGDGDTDLVLHFRLGATDLDCDSTDGTLTGETFDGQAIEGTDAVRMIDEGGGQG